MKAKIFAFWIILFILGTLSAYLFEPDQFLWLFLSLALIICPFFVYLNRLLWGAIFGLGCFFLAVFLFQNQTSLYKKLNQKMAGKRTVIGTVYDIPAKTERGVQARIRTENGVLVAYLKEYPTVKFGDKLALVGAIKEFDQEKATYLIKEKVIGEMTVSDFKTIGQDKAWGVRARGVLFWLRNRMNEEIKKGLPAEEAGLASGLILGEKALISAELKRNLQVSGTTHIIALSGYNITIILGLFAFLKTKASRLINLLVPTVFILSFVVMTGAAASIVRAAIMGFMPILARFIGRPANSLMAILVSAFLMLSFNPYLALYDVGFQLSFMAMVGLMYIGPLIHGLFPKQNALTLILAETLSAQIAVLPLIIFNFGVVSVISPLSNLSILLLVPAGMFVSFLTGFTGIFHPVLRKLASLAAFPLLKMINSLVSFFGGLPFASFQYTVTNPVGVFVMYFIIFDLVYLIKSIGIRRLSAVYQKAEASVV